MIGKILIVDREEKYRHAVAEQLSGLGYQVTEVSTGAEARDQTPKERFGAIIVDNDLEDENGIELVSYLRGADTSARLVLMVEPSFSVDSPDAYAKKFGISKLVKGPVHPEVLAGQVNELFSVRVEYTVDSANSDDRKEVPATVNKMSSVAQKKILDVRRSYQQELPAEITKLETAVKKSQKGENDREALHIVHRLAHTLHGTSGSLGFVEVSVAAAKIEDEIKAAIELGTTDGIDWDGIYKMIERAKTAPERISLLEIGKSHMNKVASILVIDEDKETLSSIAEIAKDHLIAVHLVTDEALALKTAEGDHIDGIIIDIDIDGGRAFEIVQRLRKIEGLEELPMALMAVDSSIQNRVEAAHAGATHFLQKPLGKEEIIDVARHFGTISNSIDARILVVDDDVHFRKNITAILEAEGMEVASVGDPSLIIDTIETVRPDILLLDVVMPQISGFDICRMLRSITEWKDLPILFMTAESSPRSRLECFRSGGDDYIEKPVIREELLARIGVRLERIRLFRERADRDALTGLPNRRAFLDLFKLRLAEGIRYERPVSLCMMDIDHFKHVNDTYGHLSGDRVLAGLGNLLSSRFRTVDIRGRWGGEEFVVAFYGEELDTAKMIIGRVLDRFCKMVFEGDNGEQFSCTFSGGIAALPGDGKTTNELFRKADEKLYEAKESGRNRIVN